jgi:hypothetical protein
MKSITPAFDRVIGGGLAFSGLSIFSDFQFDEGLLLSLVLQKVYVPLHHIVAHGTALYIGT